MKILLIGGTGIISTDISRLLLKQGHSLTLLNRGSNSRFAGKAEEIHCDARNESDVQSAISGRKFDVVANFIAFTPQQVQQDIRLFQNCTNQYIFISSASAYQKPLSQLPITESTPLANPYWEYSRNKIEGERLLLEAYRESGFPFTVVRPSHTYSKSSVPLALHGAQGSWQVLQRMQAGKPVVVHGDGSSLWTLTHSRDFAKAFVGLVGNPHALAETVHITSDEHLTWNQIHESIAAALGCKYSPVFVPSTLLAQWGSGFGYDFKGGLLGDKSHSVYFDNSKIKQMVPGFIATTRFDEGVRESVEHYLNTPALQKPDLNFDDFCDCVCAAMKSIVLAK